MTETTAQAADDSVITSVSNGVGRIELNKPKLINALSQDMVTRIDDALNAWRDDDSVKLVLVTGRGERGLCAGGDIKAVYNDIVAGSDENAKFWNREYKMNHAISEFPKPYVVVMNGITMGGGVGISGHGSHRIATDSTKVGMPETGIGLFPDVGGTHALARIPQPGVGMHLALTGQPIGAGDAIRYGLADTFVPRETIDDLAAALARVDDLARVGGLDGLQDADLPRAVVDRDAEPVHVERDGARGAAPAPLGDELDPGVGGGALQV